MTAAWILYANAIGILAAAAAFAIDRVFGIWALPRRPVWIAAMLATTLIPIAVATRSPSRAARERREVAVATARVSPASVARPATRTASWRNRIMRWSRQVEQPARSVWIAGSIVVAATLSVAVLSMARRRARWHDATLDGHSVLLTPDVGPAVVGFLRPRIVIPEWATRLGVDERRLMLHHEREHLLAGDPQLLLLPGILLILFPWNAALWWMTRQLRLAIEIDCDARVLRHTHAPDEYGLFLVAVGERRNSGLFLAASLAERRSSLERRIDAMTKSRPRYPLLASLPFAGIALVAATAAAQTPQPEVARAAVVAAPGAVSRIEHSPAQIRELVAKHLPAVAAGTSSDNAAVFVLASNGDVVVASSSSLREVPVASVAPIERARLERAVAAANAAAKPNMLVIPGVAEIDRSLIKSMNFGAYKAGDVAPAALQVRLITLTGNSVK